MTASGAAFFIILTALSATASSDRPLLLELAERYPDTELWPSHFPCGKDDDCLVAAGGVFRMGRWRITDWDCMRGHEDQMDFDFTSCAEYFNWTLGGFFHPKYHFEWLDSSFEPYGETDSLVFVGNVTSLFGIKPDSELFLVQRDIFRPEYHLVKWKKKDSLIGELTEYPLECEGAGAETWERSGYRHHRGTYDVFYFDYCEIRDLKGFRNLARKALKRPPSAIWQHIGDLPGEEDGDGEGPEK